MNHSKDPRPLKRSERILAKKKKRKRHLYALVILSCVLGGMSFGGRLVLDSIEKRFSIQTSNKLSRCFFYSGLSTRPSYILSPNNEFLFFYVYRGWRQLIT